MKEGRGSELSLASANLLPRPLPLREQRLSVRHQLRTGEAQRFSDPQQQAHRRLAFSALQPTVVAPVDSGLQRERILGDAKCLPSHPGGMAHCGRNLRVEGGPFPCSRWSVRVKRFHAASIATLCLLGHGL